MVSSPNACSSGELIVCSTEDAKIRVVVVPAEGARVLVVELEEGVGFAPAAVGGDIGALGAVALEDRAARRVLDAVRRRAHEGGRRATRALGSAKACSLEVCEQEFDGTLDDDGEVATRVRVAHQIAAAVELFAKFGGGGEFDFEALG